MKNFLCLALFTLIFSNTTLLAQRTPIKTVTRPSSPRVEVPKPIEAPIEKGEPTSNRPLQGSLAIRSIDNFGRSPLELPKGLSAANIQNGLPRWIEGALPIEFKTQKTSEERALQYVAAVGKAMSITNAAEEFEISRVETDEIGQTHVRMRQKLGNVPVYGGGIIVHEINGIVQKLNGAYFPTPSVKTLVPSLAATTAHTQVQTALTASNKPFSNLSDDQKRYIGGEQLRSTLVIYHKNDDYTAERLAYHVIAYPTVLHRYEYFVDAQNGTILDSFSASCSIAGHRHEGEKHLENTDFTIESHPNTEGVRSAFKSEISENNAESNAFNPLTRLVVDGKFTATALDLLGVNRTINTYQVGTTYFLLDASRPMFKATSSRMPSVPVGGIETRDYNNTDDGPYIYVTSTNNTWAKPAAVSAHYNGGVAYDYFRTTFNRNSIDAAGGTITGFINVTDERQSMDNAYWNGEAMFYGNGGSVFYPLARGLDVAGHEMSHGVIQQTANLRYQNEAGALNESFADIFGAMIDRDDWQVGEDVIKDRTTFKTGFLRDMANPNNGGTSLATEGYQPKQVSEQYRGSQDNGGVHINSGITNRAFYLFATSAAVGKAKAEQVYYRALTQYLEASSNFLDCRAYVEAACKDLYPNDAAVLTAAQTAFATVGIGTSGGTGGGGTTTPTSYQKDVAVNPGADFVVYVSSDKTKLQLLKVSTGVVTTLSSRGIGNKPSVTDNGSSIYYIGRDKKMYRVDNINYNASPITFRDGVIQSDPNWNNVAVSKDGTKIAGNEGDSLIWVYSFPLAVWKTFKIYNPTFSQNVNSDVVKYSDALEWDHFGEYVMYDAFNRIPSQTTADPIEFWDVGFVNVWSNTTRTWATGQVEKMFTSLPDDTSVGNPTFAKNSPHIVAFDFIDERDATKTVYQIRAANIQSGKASVSPIYTNNTVGYPSFSRTDNRLMVSYETSATTAKLLTIPLAATKIQAASATTTDVKTDAYQGVYFANGTRNLVSTDELDKTAVSISPNPFDTQVSIAIKSDIAAEGKVEIFDLLGKSVSSTPLSILSGTNAVSIQTSGLSAGAYLLKITVGGKTRATKIVKF
ncbi:MAG: M4 family metallopeptidase [Saprospiraceae bacterium]|nr:M4 family metallopeptidase [Saprospiraceae bacterium]